MTTLPLVQVSGLTHIYGSGERQNRVLDDVDLQLGHSESLAMLGRSGAGKSTLLNLISGIDRIEKGVIVFDGIELTGLSERDRTLFRRKNIGFVYQSFNLIPTLTVSENVSMVLELNGFASREVKKKTSAMLDAVGLSRQSERFPDQLSGGEQQRVAIARALVHTPRLLLADELTGNLDAETGQQILDLLEILVREHGASLLLVTHSMVVAGIADRIVTLEKGRLTERKEGFAW